MPYLPFVLPHWLYWGGLIIVPLIAMYIVRMQKGKEVDGTVSNRIAYMLVSKFGKSTLRLGYSTPERAVLLGKAGAMTASVNTMQ